MQHFLYLIVYLHGNIFPSWVTIAYIGKRPLLVYNAKLKAQVVPNDLTLYSLHFAHTVFQTLLLRSYVASVFSKEDLTE